MKNTLWKVIETEKTIEVWGVGATEAEAGRMTLQNLKKLSPDMRREKVKSLSPFSSPQEYWEERAVTLSKSIIHI